MALIECKECTKEFSDNAKSCPHCGNPIGEQTKKIYTDDTGKSRAATEEEMKRDNPDLYIKMRQLKHTENTKPPMSGGQLFLWIFLALLFFFVGLPVLSFLSIFI